MLKKKKISMGSTPLKGYFKDQTTFVREMTSDQAALHQTLADLVTNYGKNFLFHPYKEVLEYLKTHLTELAFKPEEEKSFLTQIQELTDKGCPFQETSNFIEKVVELQIVVETKGDIVGIRDPDHHLIRKEQFAPLTFFFVFCTQEFNERDLSYLIGVFPIGLSFKIFPYDYRNFQDVCEMPSNYNPLDKLYGCNPLCTSFINKKEFASWFGSHDRAHADYLFEERISDLCAFYEERQQNTVETYADVFKEYAKVLQDNFNRLDDLIGSIQDQNLQKALRLIMFQFGHENESAGFVSKQKLRNIILRMDTTIRSIKFKVGNNFAYNPVLTTPEVQEKYDDAGKKYIEFINELLEPSTKQNNEGNVDVNSLKRRDDAGIATKLTQRHKTELCNIL